MGDGVKKSLRSASRSSRLGQPLPLAEAQILKCRSEKGNSRSTNRALRGTGLSLTPKLAQIRSETRLHSYRNSPSFVAKLAFIRSETRQEFRHRVWRASRSCGRMPKLLASFATGTFRYGRVSLRASFATVRNGWLLGHRRTLRGL